MAPEANHQLIPPFRYAIVEENFYRGAYPTIKNFRFLRRLHLRTIISLTPEPQPNRDIREFCRHEGIESKHLYVDKYQHDGVTLSNSKAIQVLQMVIEPQNLPVYLHCLDGTHVSGLVVTCFRKLQSWNLAACTAEFCKFQREGEMSREESQFLEAFRGEIDIPPQIPPWLWQGVRTVRHPTFKLRLLPGGDSSNETPLNSAQRPRVRRDSSPRAPDLSARRPLSAAKLDSLSSSLSPSAGVKSKNVDLGGLVSAERTNHEGGLELMEGLSGRLIGGPGVWVPGSRHVDESGGSSHNKSVSSKGLVSQLESLAGSRGGRNWPTLDGADSSRPMAGEIGTGDLAWSGESVGGFGSPRGGSSRGEGVFYGDKDEDVKYSGGGQRGRRSGSSEGSVGEWKGSGIVYRSPQRSPNKVPEGRRSLSEVLSRQEGGAAGEGGRGLGVKGQSFPAIKSSQYVQPKPHLEALALEGLQLGEKEPPPLDFSRP